MILKMTQQLAYFCVLRHKLQELAYVLVLSQPITMHSLDQSVIFSRNGSNALAVLLKLNPAKYLGISRNTLEKEKMIVSAAEQDPKFEELRKKVDLKKISVDKAQSAKYKSRREKIRFWSRLGIQQLTWHRATFL